MNDTQRALERAVQRFALEHRGMTLAQRAQLGRVLAALRERLA